MPAYAIVAFIGLPLLGGLIAWAGDVIGYRLGKSRRSLFGLRPRTTARLVGVIVGAVLPLTGLIVAMLVSPMAKTAMLKLDYLTREITNLEQTNENLIQFSSRLRENAAAAEKKAEGLQERIDGLQTERSELQNTVQSLEGTRRRLSANIGTLEHRYAETQKELATTREDLNAAREDVEEARSQLEKARSDVCTLRERNQALGEKAQDLTRNIEELKARQANLQEANRDLEDVIDQRNAQLEDIRQELEQSREELDSRMAELEVRKAQLALRTKDLERLDRKYERLRRIHAGISESPVVYEAGDVLLRGIVDTSQSVGQLETTLADMLYLASAAAQRKGAERGENGRAVVLVAPWPEEAPDAQPSEEQIVAYLAREMKDLSAIEEFVVSVTAFRRLFVAEHSQLHVAMRAIPNVRVFAGDEVVADTIIAANAEPKDIFNSLLRLLRVQVRQRAQEEGLLPNPETGQYGQIDSNELFDIIDRIEKLDYDVLVQVVATDDIYTADELTIKFVVHRESSRRSGE